MHDDSDKIKAQPRTVVFISGATVPALKRRIGHTLPILQAAWPAAPSDQIEPFIEDMQALGYAVWRTPTTIFVFAGEVA